jgi:hypothetical protein
MTTGIAKGGMATERIRTKYTLSTNLILILIPIITSPKPKSLIF